MHNTVMYENLRDMLEKEVKDIQNGGNLDAQKLDHLYKLMETIKNVDKHLEREEMRASYDSRYMDGMSNNYSMMPYMDDMSYARRDNMGRYSRDNFRDSSYRGQSYENNRGYSRDNTRQKMVNKLETLMDDTMSEHERNAIMDCINKIK